MNAFAELKEWAKENPNFSKSFRNGLLTRAIAEHEAVKIDLESSQKESLERKEEIDRLYRVINEAGRFNADCGKQLEASQKREAVMREALSELISTWNLAHGVQKLLIYERGMRMASEALSNP